MRSSSSGLGSPASVVAPRIDAPLVGAGTWRLVAHADSIAVIDPHDCVYNMTAESMLVIKLAGRFKGNVSIRAANSTFHRPHIRRWAFAYGPHLMRPSRAK